MGAQEDKPVARKDLPRLERGRDLSRILAFTDGVFAIAITLLVLQIEVPDSLTSNSNLVDKFDTDLAPDLIAFAISFLVIGFYWITHHRLMRMVREYDRGLMAMTMLYLFWVVLLPFSSQLIGEYGSDITLTTVTYILNLALIGLSQTLMIRLILRHGLGDPRYEWDLELSLKASMYVTAVFFLSAPIGYFLGGWTPLLWILFMRFNPWDRRREEIWDAGGPQAQQGADRVQPKDPPPD